MNKNKSLLSMTCLAAAAALYLPTEGNGQDTGWGDVSGFPLSAPQSSSGYDIGIDADGNLFNVGYEMDTAGSSKAVIRESTDGGNNWTRIVGDGLGNVFVTGQAPNAAGTLHWTVRKLSAGQ
jgi:hypothetical protein